MEHLWKLQKIVIANPTEELLKSEMGFKDVVDDNNPMYDETKEHLVASYEEQEDKSFVIMKSSPLLRRWRSDRVEYSHRCSCYSRPHRHSGGAAC